MLSAVCVLSLVVLAPAVPVPVDVPKVEAPTGAPPALAGVKVGKDGKTLEVVRPVMVTQAEPRTEKVPVTVTVQKGNEVVTETRIVEQVRYVTVQKTVMQTSTYPLKDAVVQDLKGKKLTEDEIKKKLADGLTPIALVQAQPGQKDEPKLDPFFAQALKPSTLVLVITAPEGPPTSPPIRQPRPIPLPVPLPVAPPPPPDAPKP